MASGQTGQPPASDMMELKWDPELASIAQAHADQCKFRSGQHVTLVLIEISQPNDVFSDSDMTVQTAEPWRDSKLAKTYTNLSTPATLGQTGEKPSTPGSTKLMLSPFRA